MTTFRVSSFHFQRLDLPAWHPENVPFVEVFLAARRVLQRQGRLGGNTP